MTRRHSNSQCFCEGHRCDGWCHRNCGKRCAYHLGHSETDREENGIEGQHCCWPDHPDVWEDPDGRRVPIEGTSYRSSTIFRTTPAEREIQRIGKAWNTGNLLLPCPAGQGHRQVPREPSTEEPLWQPQPRLTFCRPRQQQPRQER